MKFQHKSALLMFVIGTTFLATVSTIYFFQIRSSSVAHTQQSAKDNIEELAYHIQEQMKKDAQLVSTLTNAPLIAESLALSNAYFSSLTKGEREEKIAGLNKKWMGIKDVKDPFVQTYISNPVASYLEKQQEMFPEYFGEIFLTNRYGALVATTKKLTTLAHGHKYWWLGSYHEGKGRVFFDDRGYDDSVKGYVLGIVIPVMEEDEIIGILKCNIKILGSYSHFFEEFTKNKPGVYSLVRSKGLVVFEKGMEPLSTKIPEALIEKITTKESDSLLIMALGDSKQIISYAPVQITKGSDQFSFGGSDESVDHNRGNKGEEWLVIFSRDLQETIGDSEKATQGLLLIGLVFVLLMAVSAWLFGRKIADPVLKLSKMTKKVGEGDFKTGIDFSSKDELGDLAKSFNKMVCNLRETTTSRDSLLEEIRQRKKAEKQSKRLETQLHQAKKMEAIGTMAGGIAHNFNNLLAAIQGNVNMVREEIPQENPTQSYLEDISTATTRAIDLVEHIVAFSNQSNSTKHTIQPNIFLHDYLDSIKDELPTNITIEQKINSDTGTVGLESKDFELIVNNLFLNAFWAMQESGGILHVNLENTELKNDSTLAEFGVEAGRFIKFTVTDTGCGIIPTNLERVFDPFFTTKDVGEGDGIGLSVIHGIVRKAGGTITVDSEVGKGSTFTVFMPVVKDVLG